MTFRSFLAFPYTHNAVMSMFVCTALHPGTCKRVLHVPACLWTLSIRVPSTNLVCKHCIGGFSKWSHWTPNAEALNGSFIHHPNNSILKELSNCLTWVIPYEPCCLFSVIHRPQCLPKGSQEGLRRFPQEAVRLTWQPLARPPCLAEMPPPHGSHQSLPSPAFVLDP